MPFTYRDAGVDISKIRRTQKGFARLLAKTFNESVISGFGHYAGLYRIDDKIIAMHTDGVGTKVMIAHMLKRYDTIGIDCIAMNVNDVICTGAKPVAFVDYIALREADDHLIKSIIKGLVKGAKEAGVAIIGGETAVMPDLLAEGQAFDLAGSVIGIARKDELILGDEIAIGDAIIGLESNGLHSNGYTLARKVLLEHYKLDTRIEELGTTLGYELLKPTRIYVKPIQDILAKHRDKVHGMAHITGGAFTKLSRLSSYKFVINMPEPKPIFRLIKKYAMVDDLEMFRTFNMGIGFCIIVDSNYTDDMLELLIKHRVKAHVLGHVEKGRGVYVNDIKLV